jgi:hypothetical protein
MCQIQAKIADRLEQCGYCKESLDGFSYCYEKTLSNGRVVSITDEQENEDIADDRPLLVNIYKDEQCDGSERFSGFIVQQFDGPTEHLEAILSTLEMLAAK